MLKFNLMTSNWINVIDNSLKTSTQSITTILKNPHEYKDISTKLKMSKVVIYRQILAILMTYYSRYNHLDIEYPYDLNKLHQSDLDSYNYDLEETWINLKESKKFTTGLYTYINRYVDKFELFSDRPYLTLSEDEFKELTNSSDASNWGSSKSALLKYKSDFGDTENKLGLSSNNSILNSKISMNEFVEKFITHLQYGETSSKSKIIKSPKYGQSYGWLYGTSQIIIGGKDLFEILINNLILTIKSNQIKIDKDGYIISGIKQTPLWERDSLLEILDSENDIIEPTNVADLYTRPTYMLSKLEYDENEITGVLFKKLPKWNYENYFIDPMVYYKENKRSKLDDKPLIPVTHSIKIESLFTNFTELGFLYTNRTSRTTSESHVSSLNIEWLSDHYESPKSLIRVYYVVSDGNPTSYKVTDIIEETITLPNIIISNSTINHKMYEILKKNSITIKTIDSQLKIILPKTDMELNYQFKKNIEQSFKKFIITEDLNAPIYDLYFTWDKYLKPILKQLKKDILHKMPNAKFKNTDILRAINIITDL